jgi:hypothetical protein
MKESGGSRHLFHMKTAILLALTAAAAQACTCSWAGPFFAVAPRADLVIRARVLNFHGISRGVDLAMDLEILETLRGRLRASKIRVWGDNGAQCRPYVKSFPAGTEWIFAIERLPTAPGDYYINGCGEFWANVEDDEAIGRLTSTAQPAESDKPERIGLDELRKRLRAADPALALPAKRD